MSLPKNEATFSISVIGETTQEQFIGDFICVCIPTIAQRNSISREEIRIIGDASIAPPELQIRGIWLAALRVQIIDGPTWWKESNYGHSLLDDNVLKEIHENTVKAGEQWRAEIKKKAEARQNGTM